MSKRKLVLAGVVAGSVGLGILIGATVFVPGIGAAASDATAPDRAFAVCGTAADSLAAAADAIGIETSELLSALRDGRTIAEVAREHGVAVSEVVDAIVAAEQDRLDQLVQDGELTQAQADEISTSLSERATALVNGDLAPFPMFGRPGLIGHPGLWPLADGPLATAARVIGIPVTDLLSSLRNGASIAEVAKANGVDASAVVDAILAPMRERLAAAVESGGISREEAARMLAQLEARITDLVNGTPARLPRAGWGLPVPPPTGGDATTSASETSLF